MASAPSPDLNRRRDWKGAFAAMRTLLGDPNDTVQVFRIMRALNAGSAERNYERLLRSAEGGRMAYRRVELLERFSDPDFLRRFAPGTVGASYRAFLDRTGYSAKGLAQVGQDAYGGVGEIEHPYAWFGRRERDIHDIWHILTGYQADDPLGELCLVAFSYAQTKGLGWGFITLVGALKNLREPLGRLVARAVWEGYRNGKRAHWLHGEDYEALFAEPLDTARTRLNIAEPICYVRARQAMAASVPSIAAAAIAAEWTSTSLCTKKSVIPDAAKRRSGTHGAACANILIGSTCWRALPTERSMPA